MDIVIGIFITLVVLVFIGWLGLKVKAQQFAPYPADTPEPETIPCPYNLPLPVERLYRNIYGGRLPVIESAIISGRAKLRLFGITFPGRFRFTHIAGQGYRHYIEATLFGVPIMKVNEYYLDGKSRLELPSGVITDEPKVDQAANLGLWGESVWLPSIFITDPRVRWEPVNDETALLVVPFEKVKETFVVRFDLKTGMPKSFEAMRYKNATDEAKTLWFNEAREWRDINGNTTLSVGAVTWFDEGAPWAIFNVEEVVYNADVNKYIRAAGP